MINKFLKLTITLFFTFAINFSANAEIKVVASIKPIHSLASYLMDGVGKPDLIVDGYNSCLLYTSPSPRDLSTSRMPSSA